MSCVYVVTRGDLDLGVQTVQAVHAVSELCLTFMGGPTIPQSFHDWVAHHKNVVVKRARDLEDLFEIYLRMHKTVDFHLEGHFETSMDTELTAFATEPLLLCPSQISFLPEL